VNYRRGLKAKVGGMGELLSGELNQKVQKELILGQKRGWNPKKL